MAQISFTESGKELVCRSIGVMDDLDLQIHVRYDDCDC